MGLLPSRPELSTDAGPRVVGVDSDDADALMAALSSATARHLLVELHEEPAPPAELADRAGTSLQNAQYHLERLLDAGAVEVVGTAYSEKGREMDVYGPADQPLVIFAGDEESASGIRAALSRLVGGVGALAVGSLAIQETFGGGIGSLFGTGSDSGGDAGAPAPSRTPSATSTPASTPTPTNGDVSVSGGDGVAATETATGTPGATGAGDGGGAAPTGTSEFADTVTETAATAAQTATETAVGGADAAAGLPPGLAFFLGGLTVLLAVVAVAYLR